MYSVFRLPTLDKFDWFHSLLSMNGKLATQYCPGVDMREWISFAVESRNSLKTRMLNKSTKKKENRICKIAIRNAGMKQEDIAMILSVSQSVVSRPLKEDRESGSIRKRKWSTLILECKELLLKHYGTWCIIWRPYDTVKGCYWDCELSKVPRPNHGNWC